MLDVVIVAIGKIKSPGIGKSSDEYVKRLLPFARLKLIELRPLSFTESTAKKAQSQESAHLMEALGKFESSVVWLLTEHGKEFDSFGFADFLQTKKGPMVFAVAGALGWSEGILQRYKNHLALSKLTMPHELARLILLEQLYRATSINNGKTYHY